jgi:hypothetical protein
MLHMSLISRSLRDRIGGSSPWFMYADDFDAGSLPETITDPHQIVLREQGASGGENCGLNKLFAAVNDGFSFDSAQLSQYSMRYRLVGERGESPQSVIRLKRLPHSACLVSADLVGTDPPDGAYDSISFDVEIDDGRNSPVIFSKQLPWIHSMVVRWSLTRVQSIASSLVFADRWIVSGSVVSHKAREPVEGRVRIGANSYSLVPSGPRNPCTIPGVFDDTDPLQCTSFGGLYVAAEAPGRALISLARECESAPRDCHFAELAAETPLIHLSWLQIALWSTIGIVTGTLFEAKRRKTYKLPALLKSNRKRLAVTVLIGALLCMWVAEAIMWTPAFLPYPDRLFESLVPTLWGLALIVFPAQVIPFIRLLGLRK